MISNHKRQTHKRVPGNSLLVPNHTISDSIKQWHSEDKTDALSTFISIELSTKRTINLPQLAVKTQPTAALAARIGEIWGCDRVFSREEGDTCKVSNSLA